MNNRTQQIIEVLKKKAPIDIREITSEVYGDYTQGKRVYLYKLIKKNLSDKIIKETFGKITFYSLKEAIDDHE